MNGLDLFAGSGIGSLALKHAIPEYRTVCYVEWDKYCQQIIQARIRDGVLCDAPLWDDIQTFDGTAWRGKVDIVSGGFPCQAFSTASRGRRVAVDLWPEMQRIIEEVKPRYVLAENVQKEPIEVAARELEWMGYTTAKIPCSASDVGADHIRRRYWLYGNAYNQTESMCSVNDETSGVSQLQASFWFRGPGSERVAYGVANRVDRLRMLGNGWVPQVVRRILEIAEEI